MNFIKTTSAEKYSVSIITVCYNAVNTIERTILSVINQNFSDFEYIIIDGKSKDGTLDIINKYAEQINIIVSEEDLGIYDAMNKGVKLAHGEWVNFMNSGDVFASNDVILKIFSNKINSDINFLYSDNFYLLANGEKFLSRNNHDEPCLLHQSSMYRKSLHNTFGYYIVSDPIIVSDYLFFCSLPKSYFLKVETIISINDTTGVSSIGDWCTEGSMCAKVVFRKWSMPKLFRKYMLHLLRVKMPLIFNYYYYLKKRLKISK